MESLQLSKQEAVQKTIADSVGEIAELRRTVTALRDEMEFLRQESDDRTRQVERAARDELKELQDTIATLRAELEKAHGR